MAESNTHIKLECLVAKYQEEKEALEKKVTKREIGYHNGYNKGEIHQLGLIIRDLNQILKGAQYQDE